MDLNGSIASACFAGAGQNPLFQSGTEFLDSVLFGFRPIGPLPEARERIVCNHPVDIHHAYRFARLAPIGVRDNMAVFAKDLANRDPFLLGNGLEHTAPVIPSEAMELGRHIRCETIVIVHPVNFRSVFSHNFFDRPVHHIYPCTRFLARGADRYPLADDIGRYMKRYASRPFTPIIVGELGYLVS